MPKPSLNGYIINKFVEQTAEMEIIFPGMDCALRLVIDKRVKEYKEEPAKYGCFSSSTRFGSDKSDSANNLCHSGWDVRTNGNTGAYKGERGSTVFCGEAGMKGFLTYTDTGGRVAGKGPNCDTIKNGRLEICNYISSLNLCVADNRFNLHEIKSVASTGLCQLHLERAAWTTRTHENFLREKRD